MLCYGCVVVAEIKKEKYVYYHCTGNKGKCPGKYAREEWIEQQFTRSLGQIEIDDEVMKQSTAEGRKKGEGQVKALAQQQIPV